MKDWHISKYSERDQLIENIKCEYLSKLSSEDSLYCSNFVWNFTLKEFILKSGLEFYFNDFFDPTRELLGIALFWDCTGKIILSKLSPIYISKNNSRKLHKEIRQQIPKGSKGALVVQFFVLEYRFGVESFLSELAIKRGDLSKALKEQINTKSFKNCTVFFAQVFLEIAEKHQIYGQELFRDIYPTFSLNQHSTNFSKEEETLFYNTTIDITTWQS